MKRSRLVRLLSGTTALCPLLAVCMADIAAANPTGGEVVAGEAVIAPTDPSTLTINQASHSAIINWQRFNIAPGETTRFVQPNSTAWALNRVTGSTAPSQILGTLEANGNVAIVNPDGILFGKNARVDVGGLVATTHDIANDDFMAGRFHFNQPGNPSASIVNEGDISIADYGLAAFVAPGVRNSGTITARLGSVGMASANSFTLDLYGDNLINLTVGNEILGEVVDVSTGEPVADLVKNDGTISADGGTVALTAATARRAVNSVINNTGVIEANTVGMRGGKIVLGAQTASTKTVGAPVQRVKVSGQLVAKNVPVPTPRPDYETGGHIAVTGEMIEVANATIDVSGEGGGGTALIGGDLMGGNPGASDGSRFGVKRENQQVPTASYLTMAADATIRADALNAGDGGKIVLWADKDGIVSGSLSARGGSSAGDGGFVETSAGSLRIGEYATVDTRAPSGLTGNWLIDPNDYKVAATGGDITGAALSNALLTNNVTIQSADGAQAGNGDILVEDAITWSSNTLTLSALRTLFINAPLMASGTAGLAIEYGQGSLDGLDGSRWVRNEKIFLPEAGSFTLKSYANDITHNFTILHSIDEADVVNTGGNYALGADIDLSGTTAWNGGQGFTPIGTSADPFTGHIHSLGHSISGLFIDRPNEDLVGFFGQIGPGAIIADANFVNVDITGQTFVGALAGTIDSGATVTNISASGDVFGRNLVGGLVGWNDGTMRDVNSAVEVEGASGHDRTGGLVGFNGLDGTIYNSYATGAVHGSVSVGGLVGGNAGSLQQSRASGQVSGDSQGVGGLVGINLGTIQRSYATGEVDGDSHVGGLVGRNGSGGLIDQVFSTATVTGNHHVGGLVGHNTDAVISVAYSTGSVIGHNDVGGLVGYMNGGTLQHTFAVGSVDGDIDAGGLVGTNFGGTIIASFYDHQTTGQSDTGKGVGLTTAEMKDQSTFINAGWDFPTIWGVGGFNNGYPYLHVLHPIDPDPADPDPDPDDPDPVDPGLSQLVLNAFTDSFSTFTSPFQPTITVTGSGFSNVTEIRWRWTDPLGNTGPIVWNASNSFGNGRVQLISDTAATISPVLVAAGDPRGEYRWEVTIIAGAQQVTRTFTVGYQQATQPDSTPPILEIGLTLQTLLNPSLSVANSTPSLSAEINPLTSSESINVHLPQVTTQTTPLRENNLWQRLIENGGMPSDIEASDSSVLTGIQCVDFVKQVYSWIPWVSVGSAANWLQMEKNNDPAIRGFGLDYVSKDELSDDTTGYATGLQIGDILIWGDDFYADGHVAIVTAVEGNIVTVSQRNYGGPHNDSYSFDATSESNYASQLDGVLRD